MCFWNYEIISPGTSLRSPGYFHSNITKLSRFRMPRRWKKKENNYIKEQNNTTARNKK